MAENQGTNLIWGRHMKPGCPLDYMLKNPTCAYYQKTYGSFAQALKNHSWDVLSLQPFNRPILGENGDLRSTIAFIDLARAKSPDLRVLLYARWPRRDQPGRNLYVLDYAAKWNRPYSGTADGSHESRDYFEQLLAELRQHYGPSLKIDLVPVGDVLAALDARMKAGKVPGLYSLDQIFVDHVHFNRLGSFIVGATYLATLTGRDPRSVDASAYLDPSQSTDHSVSIDPAARDAILQTVWDVVSSDPLAGIAPSDLHQTIARSTTTAGAARNPRADSDSSTTH
jgi:hypothetical protein